MILLLCFASTLLNCDLVPIRLEEIITKKIFCIWDAACLKNNSELSIMKGQYSLISQFEFLPESHLNKIRVGIEFSDGYRHAMHNLVPSVTEY